jgi:hypothetical protein
MRGHLSGFCLLVTCGVLGVSASAVGEAATRYVASNGTDTSSCGATQSQACRSITVGIAHANAGDLVLVGPGRYGDIDGDLQYTSPGDEAANLGLGCVVCIEKRVTLASFDGADVTVIDPGQPGPGQSLPTQLHATVLVTAAGARLGATGQGFTVLGLPPTSASGRCLPVRERCAAIRVEAARDIRVIGNTALNGGIAVTVESDPILVAQNEARVGEFDVGIHVTSESPAVIVDNVAVGSRSDAGFRIAGLGRHLIARNVATANGLGFALEGRQTGLIFTGARYILEDNIASTNGTGFTSADSGYLFVRNTAVGNDVGFFFEELGSAGPDNSFHTNNMIGNRVCGVRNAIGDRLDATNNFWGSRNGPGPKPSDSVCNERGPRTDFPSTTVTVPFATKAF